MKNSSYSSRNVPRINSAPPDEGEPDLKPVQQFNLLAEEFRPKRLEATSQPKKELRADANEYTPSSFIPDSFNLTAYKEPEKRQLSANSIVFSLNDSASEFVPSIGKRIDDIPSFELDAGKSNKDLTLSQNEKLTEYGKAESKLETVAEFIPNNMTKGELEDIKETHEENTAEVSVGLEAEKNAGVNKSGNHDVVEPLQPIENLGKLNVEECESRISESQSIAELQNTGKSEDTVEMNSKINLPKGKRVYEFDEIREFRMNFLKDQNFFIIPPEIIAIKDREVEVLKMGRSSNRKGGDMRREVKEVIGKITWRRAQTAEEKKISERAKVLTRKFLTTPDEQEKIRKQVRITLNKLSPNNQEKLSKDILETCKRSHDYLKLVVSGIFEKAWSEPKYTRMYSDICKSLKKAFDNYKYPDIDNSKLPETNNYFKYELLYMCQESFTKSHDEKDLANLTEEGKSEALAKIKKKTLGCVRFIGELYNVNLITANIISGCIAGLVDAFENERNEDKLEGACVLLLTGAGSMERPKLVDKTDEIYARLERIMESGISAKNRFKIMDLKEFRAGGWKKVQKEQLKKVEEIHADHFNQQNEILRRHGYN